MNDFITKLGIPWDQKLAVIETPIEPFERRAKPSDKINLIYFSTPQRGLELLVPAFEVLAEKYPNIHLHVFSSFKIYGWEGADKQFEPLYEKINAHPQMTYHGFSPREKMTETLLDSHILAYPCIWPETACRVLMESMSAGLMCVHPNLAALHDTAGGLTTMYQFDQDPQKHANIFYQYLDHAIQMVEKPEMQNYLGFVKAYADTRFNLTKISGQWEHLMVDLLKQYPDEDSRKLPGLQFVYRTS
jgi:glycosyltransferase involved in cell wall biosynthesis